MKRKVEFVLGTLGGLFGVGTSLFLFLGFYLYQFDVQGGEWLISAILGFGGLFFLILSIIGIIAAFQLRYPNKERRAAIFMIIAGGLQVPSVQGILFLLAGILTFIRKPKQEDGFT